MSGDLTNYDNEYDPRFNPDLRGLQKSEAVHNAQDAVWDAHVEPKATDIQINGTHYKSMVIQPTQFIMANQLGWCEGNAIKYICRYKQKNGRTDIEKAIHYLQILLESLDEKGNEKSSG
jgi:hypothetical protein